MERCRGSDQQLARNKEPQAWMTLSEAGSIPPCCPWDEREDFLLLPGDGLLLVDGAGVITYFDHRSRELIGRQLCCRSGDGLAVIWPELAEALEEHSITVSDAGPVDLPLACAEPILLVRLFRSDRGIGIVLLADRPTASKLWDQQRLMHQRILEYVRDAVIVTTAEPVESPGPLIVYANRAAIRQTGYRLSELLGRSPRLFQGPETDRLALQTFRDGLRHWQPVRQAVLNDRKDGSRFWVDIDIAPLEDLDGWYTYWVSVQREIEAPLV